MELEIIKKCPLGMECEDYTSQPGKLVRCHHYRMYPMTNNATQEVEQLWDCSIDWAARFAFDSIRVQLQHKATTESFRNDVVGVNPATVLLESDR